MYEICRGEVTFKQLYSTNLSECGAVICKYRRNIKNVRKIEALVRGTVKKI